MTRLFTTRGAAALEVVAQLGRVAGAVEFLIQFEMNDAAGAQVLRGVVEEKFPLRPGPRCGRSCDR